LDIHFPSWEDPWQRAPSTLQPFAAGLTGFSLDNGRIEKKFSNFSQFFAFAGATGFFSVRSPGKVALFRRWTGVAGRNNGRCKLPTGNIAGQNEARHNGVARRRPTIEW
jgi:hypothetical protein